MWLNGTRRPVVGRVCMDQLVVDCGDDEPELGAEVVLFGTGEGGMPTATEWAEKIGTIDYEIVSQIGNRVVRRYVDPQAPDPAADDDSTGDPRRAAGGGQGDARRPDDWDGEP